MSTPHAAGNLTSPDRDERPKTPGIKVIGWLLITSAIVPMAMAAHGEGRGPLELGLALLVAGLGMVLAARWHRHQP
jgi:hypothetical protein